MLWNIEHHTHVILNSLTVSCLEMRAFKIARGSICHTGWNHFFNREVQYTIDENLPLGQYTMGFKILHATSDKQVIWKGKGRIVIMKNGIYQWSFVIPVSLMEQELLTLPEHLSSIPVFSGVRVARSLVLYVCFVNRYFSFCTFSFIHCVVCFSSIYGFWLPLWYFQTLL